MSLTDALRGDATVIAAELRPPRAELASAEGMDAWIDTYHAVRGLTRSGTYVFLTDSAVGLQEEDNLRHLVANLGTDVPRERVVPFLTSKHTLDYCLSYAERAWQHAFSRSWCSAATSTWDRRGASSMPGNCGRGFVSASLTWRWADGRTRTASADAQVEYLRAADFTAEFFLTQIVSHHAIEPVARFVEASRRGGVTLPGMFGVFFYRSASPRTLQALSQFLPVPIEGISREFAAGATPVDVCARTIRAMLDVGVRHFYVSNLPLARAHSTLAAIMERATRTVGPDFSRANDRPN